MLRAAGSRYAEFFRLPDVTRLLAMAVLARMPLGTATLSMLLHVRALTGSFAAAGAAVGSYLAASAATAPVVSRWIDRRGPRGALVVTGVLCPGALLAIGSPMIAFGAAFVFSTLAVPTFLASPALRYWRHDPRAKRRLLGPLTEPRLLAVDSALVFACSAGAALLAAGCASALRVTSATRPATQRT